MTNWGTGAPRYVQPYLCGLVLRIGTVDSATHPPRPERGTSPSPRVVFDRATFCRSAIDHRSTIQRISFVESRSCGLAPPIGTVNSATPPTRPGAGDKPPRYILSFRYRPSVYDPALWILPHLHADPERATSPSPR